MEGKYYAYLKLGASFSWLGQVTAEFFLYVILTPSFLVTLSSYEDWGVDELIVEDSWKRQVGGD